MKEVVAIAVMDGNKLLMGRRRDTGKWTNPGGHMEPGEDRRVAAHRELREEAGIDIADMTYIGSRVTKDDEGQRLLIHCFYCHIPTGCPTTMKEDPDEEVHRWHWINVDGGCPQHVADNLHVPLEQNILLQLMECTDIKKSEEEPKPEVKLEKGAMKRLAPSKGYRDFDPEQRKQYEDWVGDYKFPEKTEMPPQAKKRLLHKLHGRTKVRMNPHSGKREYLLHRTHSQFPMEDNKGYKFDHDHSSWSTNQDTVRDFDNSWHTSQFGDGTDVKHNMISAWIPEDNISFAPDFGISPMGKSRDEGEVVVHNPERIVHMEKGPFEVAGMKFHHKGDDPSQKEELGDTFTPSTKVYYGIYEGEEQPPEPKEAKEGFVVHEPKEKLKKSLVEIYDLQKNKKEMLKMYPEEKRQEAAPFVKWAHQSLPNMNWKTWAVRQHRDKPETFTQDVKNKLQHFGGSTHIPEINDVRFEKEHTLDHGMKMLQDAENKHNERLKGQLNLVKKEPYTRIVKKFPDGKEWHDVGMEYCEAEGKAMGHCGNKPSAKEGDRVLSLRTKHKIGDETLYEPHLTFISNSSNYEGINVLGEMKGRGNEKPTKKYHDHIVGLINKGYVPMGGGYLPENNFHIDDLSKEHKDKIAKKFPMGLAGSSTHPIGTKDANKLINVMKQGNYTLEQREYDEENDEYIANGLSDYIPGHHIADQLMNNPGLNKKHVRDIIDHIEGERYTSYDVNQEMEEIKREIEHKLMSHKKTPKSWIESKLQSARMHGDSDYGEMLDAVADHPEFKQDDIVEHMKEAHDYHIDPHHPKVDKKFIKKLVNFKHDDDSEVMPHSSIMEYFRDRPELFDDEDLDKLVEHRRNIGIRRDDFKYGFGRSPRHNLDHIKKVMGDSVEEAIDVFGHSPHLKADFWHGLLDHLNSQKEAERSHSDKLGWHGMDEHNNQLSMSKNPNLTPEIVDKALEYLKDEKGKIPSHLPFFWNSPISQQMMKMGKKDSGIASRLAGNPHATDDVINTLASHSKRHRKRVLNELAETNNMPFGKKKQFYNHDEMDDLIYHHNQHGQEQGKRDKVPEEFVRERYHMLKERNKDKKRLNDDDHKLLEHISQSADLAPEDVLKDIIEWGDRFSKPYKPWAEEELEERKNRALEKTAMVGHGALGAPTSLVGGGTGAYGLKPPKLNPDIRGDGGEDRARTSLGKLFGEKDIQEMLAKLNPEKEA